MSWLRSRKARVAIIWTTTGLVVTGAGIGLRYILHARSAGGILIEAGISATVNAVQQYFSDQEEFNYAQFVLNAGFGVFGGVVNSVAAKVVGWLTTTVVNSIEADKVHVYICILLVAGVVGGALYSGTTNVVQKKAEGKNVCIKDFGKGVLVGGVCGAVDGLTAVAMVRALQALSKGASKVFNSLSGYSGKAIVAKLAVVIVGRGASGALIGTLGKVMENMLKKENLSETDFKAALHKHGAEANVIDAIWDLLRRENIIEDDKVVRSVPSTLQFPNDCRTYKDMTIYLVNKAYLWKGVRGAALEGAIVQGLMGGITMFVQQRKFKQKQQELHKQLQELHKQQKLQKQLQQQQKQQELQNQVQELQKKLQELQKQHTDDAEASKLLALVILLLLL